jgi:hypothetical protein
VKAPAASRPARRPPEFSLSDLDSARPQQACCGRI